MTVINPNSISGITSITLPSGDGNVLTIHTNDGTERFRIDSSGNVKVGSACTISQDGDVFFTGVCTATTLTGAASGLTGALPAISGANLTNLPAANLTGTLPAISGANLTGIAATDNVRTGILEVAGIATFSSDVKIGAAVTISESGIEASGIGITCANINGAQIGGRRNIIINGSFIVAQRATSSTSSGYYTVDRFKCEYSGTDENTTQAQVDVASGTTPYTSGFRKAYKVTNGNQTSGAGSSDRITIIYAVESQDLATSGWNYLSSSSYITLSYWVKSSVSQNFYGYLKSADTTSQRYVTETGSLTADTWTKIIKTIPGNSNIVFNNDNGEGLEITWEMFRGTDNTGTRPLNAWAAADNATRTPDQTSTWYTTNDATFEITGVQLEVGPQATAFEHRSFIEELRLCQRYYYKHAYGTSAGGNLGISNENMAVGMCAMYTSSAGFGFIPHPVTMRSLPTLDDAVGTDYYRVYGNGGSDNFNDISTQQFGPNGSVINYYDGFSRTQGHAGWIQIHNVNAYIAFSAEL